MGKDNIQITKKWKIEDRNTQKAIEELERKAQAGTKGNMQVHDRGLRKTDVQNLNKQAIHYDAKNKKIILRDGNDLYEIQLTKVT